MFPFTQVGSVESVLVTMRSARPFTIVLAEPVLLPIVPSGVVLVAVTELLIVVLFGVPALTFATIVNIAASSELTAALVKVTVPVPPTGVASVRVHPAGVVVETNVALAGTASLTVTDVAGLGPLVPGYIIVAPIAQDRANRS